MDINIKQCVIQRTLSGASFYRDRETDTLVEAGHAMLFRHGEDSSYGYPENMTEPYVLEFASLQVDIDLFDAIRRTGGSCVAMPPRAEATNAFTTLFRHYQKRTFRDRFHESVCVYELLIALLRQVSRSDPLRDPVAAARDYILDHYAEPFSQKEVATRVGLSREHLAREFKRRYEVSPGEYCRQLRMKRAQELLHLPFATITEIASRCGYTDAGSFARAFRLSEGISPQAYQRSFATASPDTSQPAHRASSGRP
jgi:AraC-like DNA-binding protein